MLEKVCSIKLKTVIVLDEITNRMQLCSKSFMHKLDVKDIYDKSLYIKK